jgi:hypothetical protein
LGRSRHPYGEHVDAVIVLGPKVRHQPERTDYLIGDVLLPGIRDIGSHREPFLVYAHIHSSAACIRERTEILQSAIVPRLLELDSIALVESDMWPCQWPR